jgi:hypothetical protein
MTSIITLTRLMSGSKTTSRLGVSQADRESTLSVNLKYYQRGYECFSKWQPAELSSLSNWIEKTVSRTQTQVTTVTKTCHAHQGRPKRAIPDGISPDVKLYGLDVGEKARVHGFFMNSQFFLVWLDRQHRFHD